MRDIARKQMTLFRLGLLTMNGKTSIVHGVKGEKMAEYHVGCGVFGIYAGTLNSRNKNRWQNKSEVTDEAVCAVAQYLLQEDKSMLFSYNGKNYRLCVQEREDEK